LAKALSARVVEVGGELDPGQALKGLAEKVAHLGRVGHARGVAESDLLAPGDHQALRDREHRGGRHLPLVGAAEGDGDHTLAAQPFFAPSCDHRLETGEGLLDRPVHVLSVVGLRSR